jgi:ADP-ribose pyrophosphatase YjhB (NUDIX family)
VTARCDNLSVGVLITDDQGRYLLFRRARPPVGVAPPAGHVDDHGSAEDAARAEVAEEVGLTVMSLTRVAHGWRDNACRRRPGPRGVGHEWTVYRADVTGGLVSDTQEASDARWYTTREIQSLADRTVAYALGEVDEDRFVAAPGLEPVWVEFLAVAAVIDVAPSDLVVVDRLAQSVAR